MPLPTNLYGLPLNEFISVRIEREQQAKSANDKDLAAEIHRMAKPNTVAWLANQLVRRHRDEIQTLLEVGSEMRDATATLSGNRLRELSRQQHQLIRSLVQQAERLTNSAGKQLDGGVARGLEETFHAALVDQAAADVLAAGRLTVGPSSTGFGNLAGSGIRNPRSAAKSRSAAADRSPPKGKQRRRASSEVDHARTVVAAALQARDVAHARLQQTEQSLADANDRADRLRRGLHEAEGVRSEAKANQRRVQAEFNRADRRAQDAQRRLEDFEKKQLES